MIKELIRFLMLQSIMFIDGLIVTIFEKKTVISYQYFVRENKKTPSEEQQILMNYLKKCHKQVFKEGKNAKAKSKKEET